MLSELRLRNFKAFGDKKQKALLSKITLIYGPNSGGKSSIIQALLMLKQSLVGGWSSDSGRRELMSRGEYVDLGSFFSLLHKHDINRKLGIGVTFNNSSSTKSGVNLNLIAIEDSSVLSEVGYQILDGNKVLLDAKLKYEPGTNSWDTSQLSIAGVNDSGEIFPREPSFSGKNFLPVVKILGLERTQKWVEILGTELIQERILERELAKELARTQQITEQIAAMVMGTIAEKPELVEIQKKKQLEELIEATEQKVEQKLEQELVRKQAKALIAKMEPEQIGKLNLKGIPSSYENLLRSITYMGPLRSYPERFYTVSGGKRDSVGIQGEFIPHILYYNANIKQEVNGWFDRFGIPYRLDIKELGDVLLAGKYVSIVLKDKLTNTPVTLVDVGFGINQLLPIIIEGIASKKNAIICVEQPEIHLHPRLQANIADLMIETSVGEDEKQWIVETHSELLIRRIQRRISEGTLNPNDVSVLYVNPGDDGSKIEVLELDEDGDFTDEWPHGFFDEGFNELIAE